MEENFSQKRKKTSFTPSDVDNLQEIYSSKKNILDNRQTNGITPDMKSKAKISKFTRIFITIRLENKCLTSTTHHSLEE